MMAQKRLLESLKDLSSDELNQFKSLVELEESFPLILRGRLKVANTDETVDLMVKTFSGKCVNMTKTVLKKMNRTDLVQRLSDISSGTKGKRKQTEICIFRYQMYLKPLNSVRIYLSGYINNYIVTVEEVCHIGMK